MVVKQEIMSLNGSEAVAYAVRQIKPDVVAAYPITPQTIIVERFSEYVANGEVDTEFINVESEHSAMSCCVGASLAGARSFTATASQGLALMHEILYIASGLRCPIVMAVANRALSAPINIHCDHSDSMGSRDSSWIQLYVEDAQEAYDSTIQAFKIAEHPRVQLPVMVMMDGFSISHTLTRVDVLRDKTIKAFLGDRKLPRVKVMGKEVPYKLDPKNPLTFGPLVLQDYYFEIKRQQEEAMKKSVDVVKAVNDDYEKVSGRSYGDGLLETHGVDDADIALVCLGSTAGTVKVVVDSLRGGAKVGLVRVRCYRPFPTSELLKVIGHVKAIGVLDRSISFGANGGPLFNDVKSTFYYADERPLIANYIYGLGGRDMPEASIEGVYQNLREIARRKKVSKPVQFVGVRE